jgi:hypothetical protein
MQIDHGKESVPKIVIAINQKMGRSVVFRFFAPRNIETAERSMSSSSDSATYYTQRRVMRGFGPRGDQREVMLEEVEEHGVEVQ